MFRNKNHFHQKIAVHFFSLCGHVQTVSETTLKVSATNESVVAFKKEEADCYHYLWQFIYSIEAKCKHQGLSSVVGLVTLSTKAWINFKNRTPVLP